MPGIAEQIRSLVRSATNHGRRIRRLESLQTPVTIARPQGGHIIQDEGIPLTDRVYLNFVGVRVDASDDPDNGATIITISDPERDDFCRVVPLDVGWQINVGTESRYMKHSTAFQLDAGGNVRGIGAVDLQSTRSFAVEVAEGDYSVILGGEDNQIEDTTGFSSEYTVIGGAFNYLTDSNVCLVYGTSHQINDSYNCQCLGTSHELTDAVYGFFAGDDHEVIGAFGCFSIGEQNYLIETINDYPTYTGSVGIFNYQEGDVWFTFQSGEENTAYGLGTPQEHVLWSAQFGYKNYLGHVENNYAFGQLTRSYRPTYDSFYDGRILFSGDYPNKFPAVTPPGSGTGKGSGYNQDSWFSQNDLITDWAAAWTTSRFEFPIIEDSIWGFLIYIVGTEAGCANSYLWKIEGVAENDGGTTTILTSTVTNIHRDVATKEWQVVADDPNDRMIFQFRDTAGADPTDCNIQMSLFTMEVGFQAP